MSKNRDFYLLLLRRLLLEIRNLDDSKLEDAKSLAYIFHNIPGILLHDLNEEKAEKAFTVIQDRAKYFGLLDTIEEWEKWASSQLDE